MARYLEEHAPTRRTARHIGVIASPIIEWWGGKTLGEISGASCRQYVDWRTKQPVATCTRNKGRLVGSQTARNELATLRAAVNFFNREYGPLQAVPAVTLPPPKPAREDFFLTRGEIAKRIRAARRQTKTRHIARLILLGLYSGSRPGALMKLRWLPSTEGGWVDLDNEVIHRRALGAPHTKKRQTPVRIHRNLLPHLRRWRRADMALGISHVIHYAGRPIGRVDESWESVRLDAGAERHDTPHVLRHSAATHFMQAGIDVAVVAGYLGMSVEVLWTVYGHHSPMFQEAIAQATPKKRTNRKGTQ
jgi:integrase